MRYTFFFIMMLVMELLYLYLEQNRTLIMKYEISSVMHNPGKKGYLRIHATPSLKGIKIKTKVETERQENRGGKDLDME